LGNYKFDIDLLEGEYAERMVKELLEGQRGTIEVKRDYKVSDTGNIAIEYESRGHKSGIATTEATWWAIVLDGNQFAHQMIILIKTNRLKEIAREFYKTNNHVSGGDKSTSKMVLIPLVSLLKVKPKQVQPDLI
jgi:CRISPR/Cas system endoribonuclease Cas6 (RAMP superfamily)